MKRLCMALAVFLLLGCACAAAEAPFPLAGVWRFAGGAEVCGYGFSLAEDGVCTLFDTDDIGSFPPERLIPRNVPCTWATDAAGSTFTLTFDTSSVTFPLTYEPADQAARGIDRIHLAEGDGGGFYERCDASLILPVESVPDDVLAHIGAWDPEARLMDYRVLPGVPGTEEVPRGDVGFALLDHGDERELLGFRRTGEGWQCWLDVTSAIPQCSADAFLTVSTEADAWGVTVTAGEGESSRAFVTYQWEAGNFLLAAYQAAGGHAVTVQGSRLTFTPPDGGDGCTLTWYVPRDVRYTDFAALPHDPGAAFPDPDVPPAISQADPDQPPFEGYDPAFALTAHNLSFAPDERYYVYLGPGKAYGRAGEGKAAVSTNGWIQVFGEYKGWLLIQYGVNEERFRFGWITANALPEGTEAPALRLVEGDLCTIEGPWELTDDPLYSRAALCTLPNWDGVYRLAYLGTDWSFVRAEHQGKTWWGFLPNGILGHG